MHGYDLDGPNEANLSMGSNQVNLSMCCDEEELILCVPWCMLNLHGSFMYTEKRLSNDTLIMTRVYFTHTSVTYSIFFSGWRTLRLPVLHLRDAF